MTRSSPVVVTQAWVLRRYKIQGKVTLNISGGKLYRYSAGRNTLEVAAAKGVVG